MGKHSSPETNQRSSAKDIFSGLTSRSAGRHSNAGRHSGEEHTAAGVLAANRRGPVMAAIAIPTAAAAAVLVAGVVNTPDDSSAHTTVADAPAPASSQQAPQKVAQIDEKALGEAKKAGESAPKMTGHVSLPKPKPKPQPKSASTPKKATSSKSADTSYKGKKNSKASGQGGTCQASMYGNGDGTDGGPTASGERFNANAMTAAHKTLPLGSVVKVTNKSNGKSVTVRINDRGPYVAGRCLDLSVAAMRAVGGYNAGTIPVSYSVQ